MRRRTKRADPAAIESQMDLNSEIRRVLNEFGRLSVDATTLADSVDLQAAGMSSHATVDVMIELEDTFGVQFPARMLTPKAFESISAIAAATDELIRERGRDGGKDVKTETRQAQARAPRQLPQQSPDAT
jgi:acyl carrier protein